MLKNKYKELSDYILQYNTYFSKGYDDVYINEAGQVANGKQVIFPNDKLGNYFYLRLPDEIGITNNSQDKVSDCRTPLGLSIDTYLVAIVKKADTDKLLDNIVATLAARGLRVKSAVWQREKVIMQELDKTDKEIRDKALANVNTTIVSVRFEYNCVYLVDNVTCLTNPCDC